MIIEKIANYIKIAILLLFLVIVAFLFCISFFSTAIISIDPVTEHTFFLSDNLLRNLLVFFIFIFILFILSKSKKIKRIIDYIDNNRKLFTIIKISLLILIFIICSIFILLGKFIPAADQYTVQEIAGNIVKGNFNSLNKGEYLDRCPHQSGIVLLSSLFSLFFGANNYIALCIANCIFIVIICYELVAIFDDLNFSNTFQICVILIFILFPVLLIYSYFIYGTIPGLAFAIIAFRYEIKYFHNNKLLYFLISFTMILIAQFFKTNFEIFAIAMIIYAVFKAIERKEYLKILVIFPFCLTMIIQSFLPVTILETMSNKKMDGGISNYAYIAMAMQESDRAPGWYNGFVNDSYDENNQDTNLQKEYAIKEIEKRKIYFYNNIDQAKEFYCKKISSIWNNPTFQCLWNLEGKLSEPNNTPSWIKWMTGKNGSNIISKLLDIFMMLIYLGAFLCGIFLLKKDIKNEILFFVVFFLGGFIFHLFWEGKAQYTFVYFIFLMMLSVIGYMEFIRQATRDISINKIFGCVIIVIFIILVSSFHFLSSDNDQYYEYMYFSQELNQ